MPVSRIGRAGVSAPTISQMRAQYREDHPQKPWAKPGFQTNETIPKPSALFYVQREAATNEEKK